jgi:phosphoribosylamine--glycine ligase
VVLASPGYPADPRTGGVITGVDAADAIDDVMVFHAGTRRRGEDLVTAGGRVLAVTAVGPDVAAARAKAYAAADLISWPGLHRRSDIAASASRDARTDIVR